MRRSESDFGQTIATLHHNMTAPYHQCPGEDCWISSHYWGLFAVSVFWPNGLPHFLASHISGTVADTASWSRSEYRYFLGIVQISMKMGQLRPLDLLAYQKFTVYPFAWFYASEMKMQQIRHHQIFAADADVLERKSVGFKLRQPLPHPNSNDGRSRMPMASRFQGLKRIKRIF